MTDREQSACELGSIGALSMLESRLESIRVERDGALAEVERLRRLVSRMGERIADQADLLAKRAEKTK